MRKEITGLIFLACALVACKNDVYDPNYNSNLGARVPDDFTWSTTQKLNVNVEVKDEYNGKYYYAVRVYDKVPTEGVLPVAASDKVNKDMPFSQEIVVPATVNKLYIHQVFKNADASEVITKKEVAISEGSVSCSFGNGGTTRMATTRAGGKEIKAGETLTIESGSEIPDNITVLSGGTLHFKTSKNLFQNDITINNGGKMIADSGTELNLKNSQLYNYGEVNIYDIEFDNGSTFQNGSINNAEQYEGGCFIANEILLIDGNGTGKRVLGKRSYTSCQKLTLINNEPVLYTGAWLNCNTLLVTKNGNGNGGASGLEDEGDEVVNSDYVALATIEKIILDNASLDIDDDILVQCSNAPKDILDQDNVVANAKGMITIVGTTCGGDFDNEETTELSACTYIVEDMFPAEGDYDMNDIVVSLTAVQKGSTLTITGKLKAVGANYEITPYIKVNNETKPLFNEKSEAHAALGTSNIPVNTIVGEPRIEPAEFTLQFENINKALNIDDIDFYIEANGQTIHWNTYDNELKATWGMRIPKLDFKWPQERAKITEAYTEFDQWFKDKKHPWYSGKTNSSLIYN